MRIQEEINLSGYFWLPSLEDRKLPGTLSIKDGGDIELEVIGSFDIKTTSSDDYDIGRIIGYVEKKGFVTLDKCFYVEESIPFGENVSKSKLYVNFSYFLIGYDDSEDADFNSFKFSVEGLDDWLGVSGINVNYEKDFSSATISYTPPEEVVIKLSNDLRLLITYSWRLPGIPAINEAKISQKAHFKLVSDEARPISDFIETAYKLATFLCFATDSVVSLKDIEVNNYKYFNDFGGNKIYTPIEFYYSSLPFSATRPNISRHSMLFRYPSINADFENIINGWCNAYEIVDPAFNLYFSTKMGGHKYMEGKFLSLAQGLETYHRRTNDEKEMEQEEFDVLITKILDKNDDETKEWLRSKLSFANEVSLSKRLSKLLSPFRSFFGNRKENKSLVRKIVVTRNYLTHFNEDLKNEAAQGRELWKLCCKMEALFQLSFLKLIGFSDEHVVKIVKNSYQLRNKIKGA